MGQPPCREDVEQVTVCQLFLEKRSSLGGGQVGWMNGSV